MSKRGDKEFLWDIEEAIERVNIYIGELEYYKFLQDLKTQDAVVHNLEIIGEAVKNHPPSLKKKYSNVPLKDIAGMRDSIIHFYFEIKWDTVCR